MTIIFINYVRRYGLMANEIITRMVAYFEDMVSQLFGRLIVAVIILLLGFIIGRIAEKIIHRVLHELELDKMLKKGNLKFAAEKMISHLVAYFIYFMAFIWALNAIGLTTTVLNMISGAALILIIVSILLAIKDFIPNFFSGMFIYQKRLIEEGDTIKIDNLTGKVKNVSLIETEILTAKGDVIHIPNAILTKKELAVRKKKS